MLLAGQRATGDIAGAEVDLGDKADLELGGHEADDVEHVDESEHGGAVLRHHWQADLAALGECVERDEDGRRARHEGDRGSDGRLEDLDRLDVVEALPLLCGVVHLGEHVDDAPLQHQHMDHAPELAPEHSRRRRPGRFVAGRRRRQRCGTHARHRDELVVVDLTGAVAVDDHQHGLDLLRGKLLTPILLQGRSGLCSMPSH